MRRARFVLLPLTLAVLATGIHRPASAQTFRNDDPVIRLEIYGILVLAFAIALVPQYTDCLSQGMGITLRRRARFRHAEVILDITFYRDDLSKLGPTPQVSSTEMPFDVSEKTAIPVSLSTSARL